MGLQRFDEALVVLDEAAAGSAAAAAALPSRLFYREGDEAKARAARENAERC